MVRRAVLALGAVVLGSGMFACGGSSARPELPANENVKPVPCPPAPDLRSSFEGEDYEKIEKRVIEVHFEAHPKDCAFPKVLRASVLRKGVDEANELWTVQRCDKQCFEYRVSTRMMGPAMSPTVEPVETR